MAIKLLIGGSPCTHWSIAQKNNRETEPSGAGWELFENYDIARKKFKPDFFLYENNKSASQPIKDKIAEVLGVGTDEKARFTYINSALVSAQNRQRFYVTNVGDIEMPEDRGILPKDVLETGLCATPLNITNDGKSQTIKAQYQQTSPANILGYTSTYGATGVAEPVRVGCLPSPDGTIKNSQAMRVYNVEGKSVNLTAQGGGLGAKTGLYAVPVKVGEVNGGGQGNRVYSVDGKAVTQSATSGGLGSNTGLYAIPVGYATPVEWDENGRPTKAVSCADGKTYTVYEVKDGIITIKGKEYPIKLADGFYIIRKLTVNECCRLQTMPDDYCKAVSDSQAYKGLGNGWTAEVIIHLLNHALKDVPRDEELIVLSMYDGIGTGRYCLDKMGFTNVKYYAYEIDKYPITIAMDNYPDIIQCGDAFAVREDGWKPPQTQREWLNELLGGL